jgi:hypothetical protein
MKQVQEISKGLAGRYLKKVPASAADAGRKSAGTTGIGPEDQKKQMKKGIKKFVNRNRGTDMAVNKMTGKAKVAATESFVIPEDIPVGERNAFMGAAAAAHKSGKSHFNFGGKKHPVTMKKDTAKAVNSSTNEAKHNDNSDEEERLVTMKKNPKKKSGETATMNPKLDSGSKSKESEMEQKESTIRDKLIAVLEGDRSAHYKGAAEAEPMDNNLKGDGAKKMKSDIQGNTTDLDMLKKAFDDVGKAGRAGPSMKARSNDKKDGDKKMSSPEDITKKAGMKEETRDQLAGIKAAYAEMKNGN